MGKFVFVLPIEKHEGIYRGPLPLHCTIVQPFTTEHEPEVVSEWLGTICSQHAPIELISEHEELWGINRDILVNVLKENPKLRALHDDVVTYLRESGACLVDPQWASAGYRPHVTKARTASFDPGQRFVAETAALIRYQETRHAGCVVTNTKHVFDHFMLWGN